MHCSGMFRHDLALNQTSATCWRPTSKRLSTLPFVRLAHIKHICCSSCCFFICLQDLHPQGTCVVSSSSRGQKLSTWDLSQLPLAAADAAAAAAGVASSATVVRNSLLLDGGQDCTADCLRFVTGVAGLAGRGAARRPMHPEQIGTLL